MKKIITILLLISLITITAFGLTGTYSPNLYFYKPDYGAFGVTEWTEYNTYIDIADAQIEANKVMGEASVDTSGTPVDNDIAVFTDANTVEGLNYAELKAVLDLEIGTDIQAYDAGLLSIAGLTTLGGSILYTTALDSYTVVAPNTAATNKFFRMIGTGSAYQAPTWELLVDGDIPNDITIELAVLATTFTVTDNESEALDCLLIFVDGATGAQGAETDGNLHYNPSTGLLTATGFAGALTGNVTGDVSGSSGTCSGLAATATALATARNIGGVSFDGTAAITPIYLSLDHALGSDEDYVGITDTVTVGYTTAIGDLMYFDFTATEWLEAKADAFGTTPAMRIALEVKSDGQECLALVKGYIRDDSAFDFGASRIFLNDDVAGTCDDTAPAESGDQIQVVGFAISADILFFDPSEDVGEI